MAQSPPHRPPYSPRLNVVNACQPGIPGYQVVGNPHEDQPDTDVYTVRVKGFVSVTPLSLDLTSRLDLNELERFLKEN